MGFLRRILSIKGKKNIYDRHASECAFLMAPEAGLMQEDQEAVAHRLLRSSSARLAATPEPNYALLPPIPHPINSVLREHSDESIRNDARSGYSVTIHHVANSNPSAPSTPIGSLHDQGIATPNCTPPLRLGFLTPKDQGRLHVLRSDPSIASLAELYDEHGHLDSEVFSNTPPSVVGQTASRVLGNGLTFRELLSSPTPLPPSYPGYTSSTESDISWAERYLEERFSSTSTLSSAQVRTPRDMLSEPHDLFPNTSNESCDLLSTTDANISNNTMAISSMEVEIDEIGLEQPAENLEYKMQSTLYQAYDPLAPQRASQVFSFLKEQSNDFENLSPSSFSLHHPSPASRHSESGACDISWDSDKPGNTLSLSKHRTGHSWTQAAASPAEDRALDIPSGKRTPDDREGHKDNTPQADVSHYRWQPSIARPRFPILKFVLPRRNSQRMSIASGKETMCAGNNFDVPVHSACRMEADPFTRLPSHPLRQHKLSQSITTSESFSASFDKEQQLQDSILGSADPYVIQASNNRMMEFSYTAMTRGSEPEKKNCCYDESRRPLSPSTPVRARSLQLLRFVPSPASSSELSPVTRQLMTSLRERKKTKPKERTRTTLETAN